MNTRKITSWHCTDQRDGRRVHVTAEGHTVNGASRLVHVGGRIPCADGVVPQPTTVRSDVR